ncbi:MAG: hypothetical protein Q9218_001376 [Villophora microphyllina]
MPKRSAEDQDPDAAPKKPLLHLRGPKPPGQSPSSSGQQPPEAPPKSPSDSSGSSLSSSLSRSPSPPLIGPQGPDDRLLPDDPPSNRLIRKARGPRRPTGQSDSGPSSSAPPSNPSNHSAGQSGFSGFSGPLSKPSGPPAGQSVSAGPSGPPSKPSGPLASQSGFSASPSGPSAPSAPPKPAATSQLFSSGPVRQYNIPHNFNVPRQLSQPAGPSIKLPPQHLFYPRNYSRYGDCVNKVLFFAYEYPERWANILACYFQAGDRSPRDVCARFWDFTCGLSGGFRRDWRLLDYHNATGLSTTPFAFGPEDANGYLLLTANAEDRNIFEDAVTRWARDPDHWDLCKEILKRTFWTDDYPHDDAWYVVNGILAMPEGAEKSEKIALAKKESPLFFAACLEDGLCGMTREIVKRSLSDGEEAEDIYEVEQRASGPHRIYRTTKYSSKRRKLDSDYDYKMMGGGRPTQFHAVPPEERAIDANGNQLPWALEWPDDHPNTRGGKRRPVESGPFGKSMRRKGSSRGSLRATRTATPAKKESSAVDGFMRGLEEDKRRAEMYGEGLDPLASHAAQQDTMAAPVNKEPVQVFLYGFSSPTQWAAISHYERASRGMICEDYDRHPPVEARRIPTTFSSPGMGSRRALTTVEKKMSMGYKGGKAWIRVTFDCAEAAERACHSSPHLIQGHWVYAETYVDGVIPNNDEPIPLRPEDRQGDLTTSAKSSHIPSHKTTQSLGPAFARNLHAQHAQQPQANATLPRSFISNTMLQRDSPQRPEPESYSPSTASSATATAPSAATGNTTLRQRGSGAQNNTQMMFGSQSGSSATASAPHQQGNIQYMTHFPDIPRIPLRPAHEAFLPQPTFTQRWLTYFERLGLIPGDVIGHVVPRTDAGEFDYANASFYWRFFHWLDTTFGTDICGLRDE